MRALTVVWLTTGLLACQTYDFQPASPRVITQVTQSWTIAGARRKPNVVLLVDTSGSMSTPSVGGTRMSELQASMGTFLPSAGHAARMGLVFLPVTGCEPADRVAVDLPVPSRADDAAADAANQAVASRIDAAIQSAVPSGGTPTARSLDFAGRLTGLNDPSDAREDFVLLLTDGLPNCNPAHPENRCAGPNPACLCIAGGSTACDSPPNCSTGCLDRGSLTGTPWGVLAAIQRLRQRAIRTIVIGFGTDQATDPAFDTLNAMADTGGFARTCAADAVGTTPPECGGSQCLNGGLCAQQYYSAAHAPDLTEALQKISQAIVSPCRYQLEQEPPDPRLMSVSFNGSPVGRCLDSAGCDGWQIDRQTVTFSGSSCEVLKSSSATSPIDVEFRIVEAQ